VIEAATRQNISLSAGTDFPTPRLFFGDAAIVTRNYRLRRAGTTWRRAQDGLDPPPGEWYDWRVKVRRLAVAAIVLCAAVALMLAPGVKSDPSPAYREASFSTDPLWDGYRNQPIGGKLTCNTPDFAFGWIAPSRTSPNGAIGGNLTRSTDFRAYYAKVLDQPKSLGDILTASGTFHLDHASRGGLLFGWFNSQTSYGWRTPDFLGIRLDGSRVYGEYATTNTFAGTTPSVSVRRDYQWAIEYLPDGGTSGTGLLRLTVGSIVVEKSIRTEHRLDGARFDRFGLLNAQVQGPDLSGRFTNLTLDGQQVSLLEAPGWEGSNNQLQDAADCVLHGQQAFGYSADTQFAGGDPGEIGGVIWRTEKKRAYYGDPITPVGLGDELYAEGNIDLEAATSDADAFIGWFGTARKGGRDFPANLVAAQIGGPSEWGTRLFPVYRSASDTSGSFAPLSQFDQFESAPLLTPMHRAWRFWICYQPPAGGTGAGRLTVGLADPQGLLPESQATLTVRGAAVSEGAVLTRFGIRNLEKGGHSLTFHLDNLRYTSGPGDAGPGERCPSPS